MAAFGNQYGKSPLDASKKNALPPYLDLLFEEYGVGGSDVEVLEFSLTTTGWSGSPLTKTITKSSTITDGSTAFLVSAEGETYPASGAGIKLTDITINDDGTADFEFSAPAALPETVIVVVVVVTSTSTVAARFKDVLAEINAAKTSAADSAEIATSAATLAEAYASEAGVSASAATSAAAHCDDIVSSAVAVLQGQLYPVGATYITSVNATPANILNVGTWELYDKEFEPYVTTSSIFSPNSTYISNVQNFVMIRKSHSVDIRFQAATASNLGYADRELGTFNTSSMGLNSAYTHWNVIGSSPDNVDNVDGIILAQMLGSNNNTVFTLYSRSAVSRISGSAIPSGSTVNFLIEPIFNTDQMADSACNKFYWRRTS